MAIDHPDRAQEAMSPPPYRAFLLRCWQESTDGRPRWRFALLNLGEKPSRRAFNSLEAVTAYLQNELRRGKAPDSGRG